MNLTTSLYAAALTLLYVALSIRTLSLRRRFRAAIGPGDDPVLERAIRAHGNFSEYVPISLILMLLVNIELNSDALIHGLGLTLITGRLLHAYGVSQVSEDYRFRVAGMALTFTVMLSSTFALLATTLPF